MARQGARAGAPVQLTSFVGREAELTGVAELLAHNRLVTLVGAGGIGKTRLALEAARQVGDDIDVWFVDLGSTAADPTTVLAEALGLSPVGRPTPDAVSAFLADRPGLLVMDNCEHLVDETAGLLQSVLAATAGVRVLATSREPLRVAGEQVFPVPTMALDDGDDAATCDAVRLLVDRARRVSPGFAADDPHELVELCRRLDGLPLAIELAAARLSALTAGEISAAISDSAQFLTGGVRGVVDRHASLDACVGWSYQLLAERERRALRHLSVVGCAFALETARHIVNATDDEMLQAVVALVDKSMLSVVAGRGETRYVMTDVVRRFARERLVEAGEEASARDRHLDWLVSSAVATQVEFERDHLAEHVRDWQERVGDIGAAIDWAAATGRAEPALLLAGALWRFWWAGAKGAGPTLVAAALAIPGGTAGARARALVGATLAASAQLDFGAATQHAREAVQVADAGADDDTRALARCWLGWMLVVVDPAAAASVLADALDLASSAASDVVADAHNARAYLAVTRGRLREAAQETDAVLTLTRASGNRVTEAHALTSHAFGAMLCGRFPVAEASIEAALPLVRATNDAAYLALLLTLAACTAVLTGRMPEAERRADELRSLVVSMQPQALAASALFADAFIAAARGDYARAEPMLAAVIEPSDADVPPLHVLAVTQLVHTRIALEQLTSAREALHAAMSRTTDPQGWIAGRLRLTQAQLAYAMDEHVLAVDAGYVALAIAEEQDDVVGIIDALILLASVAAVHPRQRRRSLRVAAAASAEAERLGYSPATFNRDLLRELRGLGGHDAAWAEGLTLSVRAAIVDIRTGRGARGRPPTGWDSLSPAERRVVDLVGSGRTNQQIAAALFVSAETVKGHVSASLRKLGVTSRAELAAYAARRSGS